MLGLVLKQVLIVINRLRGFLLGWLSGRRGELVVIFITREVDRVVVVVLVLWVDRKGVH